MRTWSSHNSDKRAPDEDKVYKKMELKSGVAYPPESREIQELKAYGIYDMQIVMSTNMTVTDIHHDEEHEFVIPVWRNYSQNTVAMKETDLNHYVIHAWGLIKHGEVWKDRVHESVITTVAMVLSQGSKEVLKRLAISTEPTYTLKPDNPAFNKLVDLPEVWVGLIANTFEPDYFRSVAIQSITVKADSPEASDDESDSDSECDASLEPQTIWLNF